MIPVMCCDTVNRGVAYAEGKIFLQQADTNLVALDAKTGKELWKVKNGDPKKGETNTNAPHVFKDKVITGISGGEFGVRGYVVAYDINSGKQVWKAFSTGPDAEMLIDPDKTMTWTDGKMAPVGKDSSLKTWQGDQWKIGGGTTWGWYSYDPKLNLMYYGTGNPSTWNPVQRPGDNKWSMTLFARDVDTGQARWAYQMTPHDEWDFDGVNEMIIADGINVKGKPRNVVVHFDRNGFAYTLDRTTGELLVAEKYDPTVNWATHVDMKTGRPQVVKQFSTQAQGPDVNTKAICPAALGTKDQQPAAYNPANKLFYVPTNHVCMDYEPFKVEYTAGQPYVGATLSMYPAPKSHGGMGNFIVWDAGTGKIVKSKPEKFSVWSGALVTAGGVACYGTLEGYVKCVDANDITKELYKFKTPSGIIGNLNTWEHKGKQYIGVLSGHRRLGRHRPRCGPRPREGNRGARRGRRLQGVGQVHRPRWCPDRVFLAVNRIPGSSIKGLAPLRGASLFDLWRTTEHEENATRRRDGICARAAGAERGGRGRPDALQGRRREQGRQGHARRLAHVARPRLRALSRGAAGRMVGPSLIDSMKRLSKEEFKQSILKGQPAKGMPNFDGSKMVTENIDGLYAYLKGRSDGAIQPGRLEELK